MSRGSVTAEAAEGGIGTSGPLGPAVRAAIGVSSGAAAIADQAPVVVTTIGDVESLVGIGPLRDDLVHALKATRSTIVVMPLRRNSGGNASSGGSALIDGSLSVTVDSAGYALGMQDVTFECVTAGKAGVAEFRLIVDGVALPKYKPAALAKHAIPAASLGSLATAVPTASQLQVTLALANSATAFAAGDKVTWRMLEPKAVAGDIETALGKLEMHALEWDWVSICGTTARATWAAAHTYARAMTARGRYVDVHVQSAGHDVRTGATADSTFATWQSGMISATTPPRLPGPRLFVWAYHDEIVDPLRRRKRVIPSLYSGMGHLAGLQPWEGIDDVSNGPLRGVLSIYGNPNGDQIDALDNVYYCTLQTHPGLAGIFVTHGRPWGVYPSAGVVATDYNHLERRRIMNAACARSRANLLHRLNGRVRSGSDGRIAPVEVAAWRADVLRALRTLVAVGAITAPQVDVYDEEPGIVTTDTVLVRMSFVPQGKAVRIAITLSYSGGSEPVVESEEEEAA